MKLSEKSLVKAENSAFTRLFSLYSALTAYNGSFKKATVLTVGKNRRNNTGNMSCNRLTKSAKNVRLKK